MWSVEMKTVELEFRIHLDTLEKLTSYVFPGLHEYQSHTCMTDKDCGEQENVECAKINNNARHQVCRCVDGAFLDPKSGKCGK